MYGAQQCISCKDRCNARKLNAGAVTAVQIWSYNVLSIRKTCHWRLIKIGGLCRKQQALITLTLASTLAHTDTNEHISACSEKSSQRQLTIAQSMLNVA